MGDEPRFPDLDTKRLASFFLRGAQESRTDGGARITVTADQVRWLARKRVYLALGTLPLFVLVGCGALLVSLRLTLVAVLGGFFAFACISIARRQLAVAREAVDFEVVVTGDELGLPGQAPRPILKAVDRPDYLRLMSTEARVVALWLDNRRDPSASFDLPASPQDRRALCASLRAAGVDVRVEGAVQRVVALAGTVAIGILGLAATRTLLGLTATTTPFWPMSWVAVALVVIVVWLSGRRYEW
jgi:hypothetical protein